MTADGKRSVSVGQTAKHRGADVEITNVAPDGENVKVTYPFSANKRPMWVKVEDLRFPEPLFNSPMVDSPNNELYPKGAVLTNAAGESVKVVDRFKQDVKLQLGTLVGGTLTTDFQPSADEPFTMSEQDVTEWLAKTLPSAAADTLPLITDSLAPQTETAETVATDIQALLEEIAFLKKERESLRFNNDILNKEHDSYVEDNGKLAAALMDAERRNKQLEADKARLELKNEQQSEMLRDAVPQAVAAPERNKPHLKTLMTPGGSNGFGDVSIPHGYQIVAVTTEFYAPNGKPQLVRMVHLIGCGDSPTPHEAYSEKVTVEFEKPQNPFEDLLRGNAPAEAVIEFGNAEVLAAARQAAEARLNNFVPTELPLLEGVL